MRCIAVFALACWPLMAQINEVPRSGEDDPWRPLRFLLGTWEGRTQGGAAQASASGAYTFQLDLRNHVLARHTAGDTCKGPADFNCEHSDLLYVYRPGPGQLLKAIYFDNEGHVINYDVTTPEPNTAVFMSPATGPGPQFRLMYKLDGRVMKGAFQMRMPGQNDFRSYLEWAGAKK